MKFTAQFRFVTTPVEVTWEDGRLSGDNDLCRIIQIEAQSLEGRPVGPPGGPHTTTNHLSDPLSALMLMRFHLPEPIKFLDATGDVPTVPPVPDGAIP